MLPLPSYMARMPGAGNASTPVYVRLEPSAPGADPVVKPLGQPGGSFDGANAFAAGQASLGGVNLADGRLALSYEDYSARQFNEAVAFRRTYNNLSTRLGALGQGWWHNWEGMVIEERVGRYAVLLEGQSYEFVGCDPQKTDAATGTAKGCTTDNSHGGTLEVRLRNGNLEALFQSGVDGRQFLFAQQSAWDTKPGRRRWLLTAMEDGHARDAKGNAPDTWTGEEAGSTKITYEPGSDRIATVQRLPAGLQFSFTYQNPVDTSDETIPLTIRSEARTGFRFLKSVSVNGTTIEFTQGPSGNLEDVTISGDPKQHWHYAYEPVPAGASGAEGWALTNELKAGTLTHFDSQGSERVQWQGSWTRALAGSVPPYTFLRRQEMVGSFVLPGQSGTPYSMGYTDAWRRTILRPDGVQVDVKLNDYGNVVQTSLPLTTVKSEWYSDIAGGMVSLKSTTEPSGRSMKYAYDARLRPQQTTLGAVGVSDLNVDVVGAGQVLESVTKLNDRFCWPEEVTLAASPAVVKWSRPLDEAGNVSGQSASGAQGTVTLSSGRSFDADGVLLSEVDEQGRTVVYSDFTPLGLPQTATLTLASADPKVALKVLTRRFTYDAYGRVASVSEDETGHAESVQYDSIGRIKTKTRSGTPSQTWSYDYVPDDNALTVTETLAGTSHERTRHFTDGQLDWETTKYASPVPFGQGPSVRSMDGSEARREVYYAQGRVDYEIDERGRKHQYHYDADGRLDYVDVGGFVERKLGYDADGRVTSVTDEKGATKTIGYDALSREVQWSAGSEVVEAVALDGRGGVVKRTSGQHVLNVTPDVIGREATTQGTGDPRTVDETVVYDAAGRPTSRVDQVTGLEEHFEYQDAAGRMTLHTRRMQTRNELDAPVVETYQETRRYVDADQKVVVIEQTQTEGADAPHWTATRNLFMDAAGRLQRKEETVDGQVAVYAYQYDAFGNVIQVSEPQSATSAVYQYDAANRLMSKQDALGNKTQYEWNAAGQLAYVYGPDMSLLESRGYDDLGRLGLRTNPGVSGRVADKVVTLSYPGGGVVIATDASGTTAQTFDGLGRLVSEEKKDAASSNVLTRSLGYDGTEVKSETAVEGSAKTTWSHGYDDRGRETSGSEDWAAGQDSYQFTRSASWAGRTATLTWSSQTSAPKETRTRQVEVDSLERVIRQAQGGVVDRVRYDATGRALGTWPAGMPNTSLEYADGLLMAKVFAGDPTAGNAGERTTLHYEANGQLKSETGPDGRVHQYGWDERRLLSWETYGTDSQSERQEYAYDAYGRLQSRWKGDRTSPEWGYEHAPSGELMGVLMPGQTEEMSYGYDGMGRLSRVTRPSGGMPEELYEYDYLGRETKRTRGTSVWTTSWASGAGATIEPGTGTRTTRQLDAAGRTWRKSFQPGPGVVAGLSGFEYAYNSEGQLLQAIERRSGGDVTNVLTYDARGRLAKEAGAGAAVVHTYYDSGQAKTVEWGSNQLAYDYDSSTGRLSGVTGPSGRTGYTWEPGGARLLLTSGGGLAERRCYYGTGRVRAIVNGSADAGEACLGGGDLVRFDYVYDTRGNRWAESRSELLASDVTEYGYDPADRLTGVLNPGGTAELYQLAGDGTRQGKKVVPLYSGALDGTGYASAAGGTAVYGYDNGNGGLSSITEDGAPAATIVTDAAGRVKQETWVGKLGRSYGWDPDERIVSAQVTALNGNGSVSQFGYGYDFAGRRRNRTGGSGRDWTWAGSQVVEEKEGEASWVYERAGGFVGAVGGVRAAHDALGSVVGYSGLSVMQFRTDAWGRTLLDQPGTISNCTEGNCPHAYQVPGVTGSPSLGSAGTYAAPELGDPAGDQGSGNANYYAEQRWGNSTTGQWGSQDPVFGDVYDPMSMQPFLYANGNPLRYTDPTGEAVRGKCLPNESWAQCGQRLGALGRLGDEQPPAAFRQSDPAMDAYYKSLEKPVSTPGHVATFEEAPAREERMSRRRVEFAIQGMEHLNQVTAPMAKDLVIMYVGGKAISFAADEFLPLLERGAIGAIESGASRQVAANVSEREALLDALPLPGSSNGALGTAIQRRFGNALEFPDMPGFERIEDAVAGAQNLRVRIPQGVEFRGVPDARFESLARTYGYKPQDVEALYTANAGRRQAQRIAWSDLFNEEGALPVFVRQSVLQNQARAMHVIAHESAELRALENVMSNEGGISPGLWNPTVSRLHFHANDYADYVIHARLLGRESSLLPGFSGVSALERGEEWVSRFLARHRALMGSVQ